MMSDNFVLAVFSRHGQSSQNLLQKSYSLFIEINLIQQKLVKYILKYYHFFNINWGSDQSASRISSANSENINNNKASQNAKCNCRMYSFQTFFQCIKLLGDILSQIPSQPCRWTSSKKFTLVENRKLGKIILPFQIYRS